MSVELAASALAAAVRPAMGSDAIVAADVAPPVLESALDLIDQLEGLWSSFIDTSEIAAINRASGPVVVDQRTAAVIALGVGGRAVTDGWYDPTLDRSEVTVDPISGLVLTSAETRIDLGGIGKGRSADLAAAWLRDQGAGVATVAVGGDVRVLADRSVKVEVEGPSSADSAVLTVRDAGIAMSGPTREGCHLIDPHTGSPCASPRVALVIARSGAGAEMLATGASIGPPGWARAMLEGVGATAWLIESDGSLAEVGEPHRFLSEPGWLGAQHSRSWSPGSHDA